MILPDFDPVIFSIGPLAIRWYSLAYILGIVFAFLLLKKANNDTKIMSEKALDDWIMWSVLGIIIGGRLGYVLFYNFGFYIDNPGKIFAIWHGGMSFHGGLVGSIVSMYYFAKKYEINYLKLMDIVSVATPIGLFFGRIANFINMELYGRVTTSKFGVIFPNAGSLPRHPSQLYEAFLEGLLSFFILFYLYKFTDIKNRSGFLCGLFLSLYAISRIIVEFFREPDIQLGLFFSFVTMGQILSLPILLVGLLVMIKSKK